jgi:hypothetical protein
VGREVNRLATSKKASWGSVKTQNTIHYNNTSVIRKSFAITAFIAKEE